MDFPNNDIKLCDDKYNQAVEDKNYELGIREALKGYELATKINDHVFTMYFLAHVRIASENLYNYLSKNKEPHTSETGNQCSFCKKTRKDLKLLQGVDGVSICYDCAKIALEELEK